jgi:hypothetical protein
MMRLFAPCLTLAVALATTSPARAGFAFSTQSTAAQTLTSPLFDPTGQGNPTSITIIATGPQQYAGDVATGTSTVASQFHGFDFPTPFGLAQYDLYNTTTTGTITPNGSGGYNDAYTLLFELAITSGPLTGVVFETKQTTVFTANNIPTIPFPVGTAFSSLEPLAVYLKTDPTNGALGVNVGSPVGVSSNRVVTITAITTPLPPTALLLAAGPALLACGGRLRRMLSA